MELIDYMRKRNQMTKEEWENSFYKKEQEILVLRHEGDVTSKRNGFWEVAICCLAFISLETGELHKEECRFVFAASEKEYENHLIPEFDDEAIYHLKVRKKLPEELPEIMIKRLDFLLVSVIEKDVKNPELEEILTEYKKPVIIGDDILGEPVYDKKIKSFEGHILWNNKNVDISLDVDKDNKSGITKARKAMKEMLSDSKRWDTDMRTFAAIKLTDLARDWCESEEEALKITEESFAKRITLRSISMTSGGSFTACFNDDDIFAGHCIIVNGSLKKGISSASMGG
ncbi:hypothetical protein HMPREF0491_00618 [Lachnospiraceae oral taxon 107 str. F0167]|jgi:hypothetical protein|nr:hypothetical protein HMPREF0491_00618 [Lachnospiraceae oral taxon 107 str. F0167]